MGFDSGPFPNLARSQKRCLRGSVVGDAGLPILVIYIIWRGNTGLGDLSSDAASTGWHPCRDQFGM